MGADSGIPVTGGEGRPAWWIMALALLIVVGLAGCQMQQQYPLNMTQSEWEGLTPDQQFEARQQQAELDAQLWAAQQQQQAAQAQWQAEQARLQDEQAAAEQRRLDALYRSGRPGDVVECIIEGGFADFFPGWRPFRPAAFTLVRGEGRSVVLTREDGDRQATIWAGRSDNGTELRFCRYDPSVAAGANCAEVFALTSELIDGITRPLVIHQAVNTSTVRCSALHAGRPQYRW